VPGTISQEICLSPGWILEIRPRIEEKRHPHPSHESAPLGRSSRLRPTHPGNYLIGRHPRGDTVTKPSFCSVKLAVERLRGGPYFRDFSFGLFADTVSREVVVYDLNANQYPTDPLCSSFPPSSLVLRVLRATGAAAFRLAVCTASGQLAVIPVESTHPAGRILYCQIRAPASITPPKSHSIPLPRLYLHCCADLRECRSGELSKVTCPDARLSVH